MDSRLMDTQLQVLLSKLTHSLETDRQRHRQWEGERENLAKDQQSLRQEQTDLRRALRILREQEAKFVFETDVPPQVVKEIHAKEDKIAELESKIAKIEQQLDQPPAVNEARGVLCSEIIAHVQRAGWDAGNRHQLEQLGRAYADAADVQRVWEALAQVPVRRERRRGWLPIGIAALLLVSIAVAIVLTRRPPGGETETVAAAATATATVPAAAPPTVTSARPTVTSAPPTSSPSATTTPAPSATPTATSTAAPTPTSEPAPFVLPRVGILGGAEPTGWMTVIYPAETVAELAPNAGQSGGALRLSYVLAENGWAVMLKRFPAGWLVGTDTLRFSYRGSGADSTLEAKLLYEDQTNPNGQKFRLIFGRQWPSATHTDNQWVTVDVPYTEFACWPGEGCEQNLPLDLGRVNQIEFAASHKKGDEWGVPGELIIDNVQALRLEGRPTVTGGFVPLLGEGAPMAGWQEYTVKNGGSTVRLAPVAGQSGSALEIGYQLAPSEWVGAEKDLPARLLEGMDGLQISYQGTGATNTIELKLIYDQAAEPKGAVFSRLRYHVTNTEGEWVTLAIPFTEFGCWPETGCAAGVPLDPARIGRVDIAISNKVDDEAGVPGVLVVDNLRGVEIH